MKFSVLRSHGILFPFFFFVLFIKTGEQNILFFRFFVISFTKICIHTLSTTFFDSFRLSKGNKFINKQTKMCLIFFFFKTKKKKKRTELTAKICLFMKFDRIIMLFFLEMFKLKLSFEIFLLWLSIIAHKIVPKMLFCT